MTEHLMITSLPKVFKTLLFVCQFWSLALVAMVRQPKVLLMIIHSLLWLCSNISQRLFVCCIFVLRSSDIWWLHRTALVPRPKC